MWSERRAATLIAVRSIEPRLFLARHGLGVLIAGAGVLVAAFEPMSWNESPAPIGLHPGLWLAIAYAAAFFVAASTESTDGKDASTIGRGARALASGLGGALLLGVTSLEAARWAGAWSTDPTAARAGVTIWWGVFSIAMLVLGFVRRWAVVRYLGLGLLGIALGKAVMVDMAGVPAAWRIASFVGLGLLMMGVAVGYSKVAARLERLDEGDAEARRNG